MKWSVVAFDIDNSVEAVPNHWFKNEMCAWPVKSSNVGRLIEKRTQINKIDFKFLKARVLLANINSLTEARLKANKGKTTSDLSSADDQRTARKSRFRSSVVPDPPNYDKNSDENSSDSTVDDEDRDPMYGNDGKNISKCLFSGDEEYDHMYDNNDGKNNFSMGASNSPDLCNIINTDNRKLSFQSQPLLVEEHEDNICKTVSLESNLNRRECLPTPKSGSKSLEKPSSKMSHDDYQTPQHYEYLSTIQSSPTAHTTPITKYVHSTQKNESVSKKRTTEEQDNMNKKHIICENADDQLKMMNKAIIGLKYELKSVSYNIDSLQTMTKNIMDKLSSINSLPQSQDSDEYKATFADTLWPIQNENELNEQERLLKEDLSERNIIIKQLSRHSGKTIQETIRRIMQNMFSDELLKDYSYLGFKGKNIFSTLGSCKLIFDSVRKIQKFKDACDLDISLGTKGWMAQASNRIKKKEKIIARSINSSAKHQ